MSWLVPNIIRDYWGTQNQTYSASQQTEEGYTLLGYTFPKDLAEALGSFLPTELEKFKNAMAAHYDLTYMSSLHEGKNIGVFQVSHRVNNQVQVKALRLMKIDVLPPGETKETHFNLTPRFYGTEWHIFLSGLTPYPRPEAAIAWNHDKQDFEVLTREEILNHFNQENVLGDSYTLYGILSPYPNDQAPLFVHSSLTRETHQELAPSMPTRRPDLLRFILATSLRGLKVIQPLGSGSFSKVWQVQFTTPEGKEETMALRLSRTDSDKIPKGAKAKYFQISKNRFGGEFGAFLPDGPYVLSSHYAIVWDHTKQTFRLMGKEEINAYHQNLSSVGENVFTLFGTLSECHQHAEDLSKKMNGEKFPLEMLKRYAFQLLLGLKDFPKGMLHRDLKPANILLTTDDQKNEFLKILDFGFSRADVKEEALADSAMIGTPLYMAPEVFLSDRNSKGYDQKADLYSLGVIFFEMATGHVLVPAKSFPELGQKLQANVHENKDPKDDPRLADFDNKFRDFISHLSHPDPKERWTIEKILSEDPFLGGIPSQAPQKGEAPNLLPPPSIFPPSLFSQTPKDKSASPPSLAGRVGKLFVIAGAAFVLYHIARKILVRFTRPHYPKGKSL